MKVAEYIACELIENGVTDAFGVPGGVILSFIYAMKKTGLTAHLTYHEQTAGFAACGYAQACGRMGVAYATRGPGICNMMAAIAEAYQESVPVLFITAHGSLERDTAWRFSSNQELHIVESVRNITKYAVDIDRLEDVIPLIRRACGVAMEGRRGPVLIDIYSELWERELKQIPKRSDKPAHESEDSILPEIGEHIFASARPVLLIGDGLRYAADKAVLSDIAAGLKLPVLSSRGALDLLSGSPYYFGYIGSHGLRYSNFILSKADLIIAAGNRLAFPHNSASFSPVTDRAKVIRLEIDGAELTNPVPGEIAYLTDVRNLTRTLRDQKIFLEGKHEWLKICERIRAELSHEDCTLPVQRIEDFILKQGQGNIYVCDVGNNEFWFTRAYARSKCEDSVILSKSFGTLGSAIGKAIGACYATEKQVICVVGDQGLQFNVQELQYIVSHHLPIKILLINNHSSGMIADHEQRGFGRERLHVTRDTGYTTPDFEAIANAYGADGLLDEISVDSEEHLTPYLMKGRPCQDMSPPLDRQRYEMLNSL